MEFVHRSYEKGKTIAAIATPKGEGGIAIIRVSGNEAFDVVNRIFQNSVVPLLTERGINYNTTTGISPSNYNSPFIYINIGLFSCVYNVSKIVSNTIYNPVVSFKINDFSNNLFVRDPVPSSFNDNKNLLNNINSCPKIILFGLDYTYNWNQLTPYYYPYSGFNNLIFNLTY